MNIDTVYRIQILCIRYSDNSISVFIFFLSPKVNVALYSHFTHSIKYYYNIIWKAAFVHEWSYGYVSPIQKQNYKIKPVIFHQAPWFNNIINKI